jgi:5-methylcytosine-specific restriction endonuclease McrA
MRIAKIKRPWNKEYGIRPKVAFYHSAEWRKLRKAFISSTSTLPDGRIVPNSICVQCYLEGRTVPVHTVDHIKRIRDGGESMDMANLQSLCITHHHRKSAAEGNEVIKSKRDV